MGPLIVIVGETASGKSALAMELARKLENAAVSTLEPVSVRHRESQARRTNGTLKRDSQGGKPEMAEKPAELTALQPSRLAGVVGAEIICADSRTVYKGMDIGTAKPSLKDQTQVKHYGLDLVNPDERFTAADFKDLANKAIGDICKRGKLPIMVGGTGLYIDAVLYDFEFLPEVANSERDRLKNMSVEQLRDIIINRNFPMPENAYNPRHLQRVIETAGQSKTKHELRPNTLILGTMIERDELKRRIENRVDLMLKAGLLSEISILSSRYGWDAEAMSGLGYRELKDYSEGHQMLAEARERIIQSTMNLAKKQRTWFKRNRNIHWFSDANSALAFAENWLIDKSKTGKNTSGKIEP